MQQMLGTLEKSTVIAERQGEMPGAKRNRRERTDEWASIKQWTLWPEQKLYEQIRPLASSTKPQGSELKQSMSPSACCLAKLMSLKNSGCAACLHPKSMAV
jgi:hypothetical protein